MTPEVLQFLRNLLAAQTLSVGAPDYRETAALVSAALDQLDAALSAAASHPA